MPEVLTAEQVENEVLIANSFEGHEGRPGERGGSVARGDQTDSKAFRAWFGDSKVVDKDGKPLVKSDLISEANKIDRPGEWSGHYDQESGETHYGRPVSSRAWDIAEKASPILRQKDMADYDLHDALWQTGSRTPEQKAFKIAAIDSLHERAEKEGWNWGYKDDPEAKGIRKTVIYFDTPEGQASFHVSGKNWVKINPEYDEEAASKSISQRTRINSELKPINEKLSSLPKVQRGGEIERTLIEQKTSLQNELEKHPHYSIPKNTTPYYQGEWSGNKGETAETMKRLFGRPTQIKSAIGNKGTWSKTDPNIANELLAANADALNFPDALVEHQLRPFIPTGLSHQELQEQVEPQIRERALMMARVTNAEYGEKVRELCAKIENGQESLAHARTLLGRLAAEMGYEPEAGKEGTIEDLGSDARLDLILRTQVEMADGYGQWKGRQEAGYLQDFPCLEFYRAFDRKEPRDWPARWSEAGGEFFDGDSDYTEGRMVAPANSPIWEAISAFGTPYPPFDFNSGMMTEPVSREEAVELGVIAEGDMVHPQQRDFAKDASASVKALSDEMEQVLIESLGGGWETVDGFLVKANERMIDQLANSILIANSFPNHEGRPGERGGSVARGDQTDSKAFRAWFGSSKVVDKDGKPLVVYHGTTTSPEKFRDIAYFSSDKDLAEEYANKRSEEEFKNRAIDFGVENAGDRHEGAAVQPVFLSIKKPLIVKGISNQTETIERAKEKGYDGIIFRNADDRLIGKGKADVYVAFHPTQIKSAIGNKGTWSKTDPNIANEVLSV